MGWYSFFVAVGMSIASGVSSFDISDGLVFAFLAHTAACFSMPTIRNITEGYAPNAKSV